MMNDLFDANLCVLASILKQGGRKEKLYHVMIFKNEGVLFAMPTMHS